MTAREIYQHHLDIVSRALWDLDHDTMAKYLGMPNRMGTTDASILLDSQEKLRQAATDFRTHLSRMGAQHYHRLCTDAAYDPKDPDRIHGTHVTHILSGGAYVVQPFDNRMTLVRKGDIWLGIELRAVVGNAECTIVSPSQLRATHASRMDTRTNKEAG